MSDAPSAPVELPVDAVRSFAVDAYQAAGMAADDAATMAGNQMWSDLRGVDTHGVQRIPWYLRWFAEGRSDPTAQLEIVSDKPAALVGDGHGALGQLVATHFVQRLIAKARGSGIALGVLRHSNDWGCGAWYPNLAADAGLVAMATTTSVPNLAPFGARTRLFGNNPIAFAFPRRAAGSASSLRPIIYDGALTPVALGKVLRARSESTSIPEEWGFRDRDGRPTTDPQNALDGIIPAIGGYKGTGLALVTNVLAGVLSGSAHTAAVDVGRRGQFFLLVDPGFLGDADGYYADIEDMVAQVRAAEVLPGQQVFLPGEPEWRTFETRSAAGVIPYPASVVRALDTVADDLAIEPVRRTA
jgi:LDH2 family malate/lactate/ureidoglycolate dehydrogenase